MNDKLVFCIDCQETVSMECGPLCGHILYIPIRDENGFVMGVDVDFCEMIGGFTFSPPPAVDPDWIDNVVEQGVNELEIGLDTFAPHYAFELMREPVKA